MIVILEMATGLQALLPELMQIFFIQFIACWSLQNISGTWYKLANHLYGLQ